MCNYQSWFRVNQRWISAVQRWKSYVSELTKSALNSADSELFVSETALFSSEQRWFKENQSWSALKQSWSALMFIMFPESALKNVKTMKQRCSALITSGTSTRALFIWVACCFSTVNFCHKIPRIFVIFPRVTLLFYSKTIDKKTIVKRFTVKQFCRNILPKQPDINFVIWFNFYFTFLQFLRDVIQSFAICSLSISHFFWLNNI